MRVFVGLARSCCAAMFALANTVCLSTVLAGTAVLSNLWRIFNKLFAPAACYLRSKNQCVIPGTESVWADSASVILCVPLKCTTRTPP